ncbi:MAG: hypothetical protein KGV46_03610, partial [Pasteurella sp.]|nr:hypothetical protein [Pasteurella sp.]
FYRPAVAEINEKCLPLHDYLKNNKIPVMVIGANITDIKQLNTLFQGVFFGVEPKPRIYTEMLLKQLGGLTIPITVQTITNSQSQTNTIKN